MKLAVVVLLLSVVSAASAQTPPATDARARGLRGAVRSVREEVADLRSDGASAVEGPRRLVRTEEYDAHGRLTAATTYSGDNKNRILPGYMRGSWADPVKRRFLVYDNQQSADERGLVWGGAARRYPWRIMPYMDYAFGSMIVDRDLLSSVLAEGGIPSIAASYLGGTLTNGTVQYLSSLKTGQGNSIADCVAAGDFTAASGILDKAIDEISTLRGRLGAFEKNVLQTNVSSMQSAFENLSASNSQIRDADFAEETSMLTRAQILSSSGTSVLGLANQQSQQVLQLLG